MFNKSFLKKNLTYFLDIYKNRPIKNNQSGMKIDHCFALFCLLKKINEWINNIILDYPPIKNI